MNERKLKRTVYTAAIYYLFSSNLAIGSLPDGYNKPVVQEAVVELVVKKPRYGIRVSLLSTRQKKYLDEKFADVKRRYQRTIEDVVDSLEINHDFVAALITAESGGNPLAISKQGAAGLMQLMPGTAKAYGLKVFEGYAQSGSVYAIQLREAIKGKTLKEATQIDERFDPIKNTRAGARYLSTLSKNDIERVLAYNLGPTRFINTSRKRGFNLNRFPKEPRTLAEKVHHLYNLE